MNSTFCLTIFFVRPILWHREANGDWSIKGPRVNATDFAARYHWRWFYYFKAPEQLIFNRLTWVQCKRHCAGWAIIAARLTACLRQKSPTPLRACKRIIPCASPARLPIPCAAHYTCREFPLMSSAPSRSLINLLLESGVTSNEEAEQLAINLNGGSWIGQVLDSGKVDEQQFLGVIGNFFRVPVISIDAKKIDRETLSILPSRFVFQHHILPIEVKENSVVLATYDLFNSMAGSSRHSF